MDETRVAGKRFRAKEGLIDSQTCDYNAPELDNPPATGGIKELDIIDLDQPGDESTTKIWRRDSMSESFVFLD